MTGTLQKLLLVQEGEAGKVLYFFVFFMLVSAGMAVGRGTADAMFLKQLGIESLPLMYMAQSFVLAMVSLVYTAFADRIVAEKLFRIIFLLLMLLVFAAWLVMSTTASRLAYPAYYLVYEIASEVLLIHTALYMNQNMTTLQAKRLTPLFFGGAQVGTISGGLLLAFAAPAIGTRNLLVAWCLLLAVCTLLIFGWHAKYGPSRFYRAPSRARDIARQSIDQVTQGVRYTWTSGLLRAASGALFFMVIAFYVLCYSVNRVYTQTFPSEAELAGFFGMLAAATSLVALVAQVFVTSRVIDQFGVRRVNLVFPWTTLLVLGGLAGSFTMPFALLGSLNKDALMPAFRNPVRTLFFNIIPGYMQGRARAISVAVILPAAMFFGGLMLWFMQRLDNPVYFLLPGMVAALLYLYFNVRMNNAYAATLITTLRERLFLPSDSMYADLSGSGKAVLAQITRGINHAEPEVAVAFARLLAESFPGIAADMIIERARAADAVTADRLLNLLPATDMTGQFEKLGVLMTEGDAHLQATIMRLTADQMVRGKNADVSGMLENDNPRLCVAGIHVALRHADPVVRQLAFDQWLDLLAGSSHEGLAALDLMEDVARLDENNRTIAEEAYQAAFERLLKSAGQSEMIRVLRGISKWHCSPGLALEGYIESALQDSNPDLREAAAACIHHLGAAHRSELFLQAAGDSHPRVRQATVLAAGKLQADYAQMALNLVNGNRGNPRAQQVMLESLFEAAIPHSRFSDIAMRKAGEAETLQQALQILKQEGAAGSVACDITAIALQERLEQTIQLALLALEPLYEPGLIQTIRAGLASDDERHIANAREALATLDCNNVRTLLDKALKPMTGVIHPVQGQTFHRLKDVVEWCARHPDEWLNQCARYVTQQLYPEDNRA